MNSNLTRPISPASLFDTLVAADYKQSQCHDESTKNKQQRAILIQLIQELEDQIRLVHIQKKQTEELRKIRQQLMLQLEELRIKRNKTELYFAETINTIRLAPVEIRQNANFSLQIQQARSTNHKLRIRIQDVVDYIGRLQLQNRRLQEQRKVSNTNLMVRQNDWRTKICLLKSQQTGFEAQLRIKQGIKKQQTLRMLQARQRQISEMKNRKKIQSMYNPIFLPNQLQRPYYRSFLTRINISQCRPLIKNTVKLNVLISYAAVTSQNSSSLDASFQSNTNAFDFCVHFINRADDFVDSQFVNAEDNLTLDQCLTILQDKLKRAMTDVIFKKTLQGQNLPGTTTLSEVIHQADDDIYFFYDGIKPILVEQKKQIKYDSITKYSFLDQPKFVKIYIPLPGIGSIPATNITSRFLDRSIQVKIHDYQNKNWIFAVPKTQCCILVKNSKVVQKADKLIISVGKMAQSDNWFSLHKVKCIGEKDTD